MRLKAERVMVNGSWGVRFLGKGHPGDIVEVTVGGSVQTMRLIKWERADEQGAVWSAEEVNPIKIRIDRLPPGDGAMAETFVEYERRAIEQVAEVMRLPPELLKNG